MDPDISQFDDYQPIVEKIVNSFNEYSVQNETNGKNVENISLLGSPVRVNNSSESQQNFKYEPEAYKKNTTENLQWSEFIDPDYNYMIDYPSNMGFGKPLPAEEFNSSLTGNLFLLDNTSIELKDAAALTIDAFYKDEKPKIKKFFNFGLFEKMPDKFDIDFIVSSANKKLGVYEMMPSFNLLKNNTLNINNKDAYLLEFVYYNPVVRDDVHEVWTCITDGSHLAILQLSTSPQNYKQYYPVFQRMLNSFEFAKE